MIHPSRFHVALLASTAFCIPSAWAQGPAFQTPGMPAYTYGKPADPDTTAPGQTSRFTSVFNPAFSFVVDTLADYVDTNASDDGFDADLRALELGAQSWVDPNAWAYFVAVSDGESLNVEEAAVHCTGLGGNSTLRVGRFFIDFGKQMQAHVHDLRTVERPLVLRAYLGDEVKGDGVQWDSWTAAGDTTVVRWSVGAFGSLLPEEEEDVDSSTIALPSVDDRKHADDFGFTARVTAFTDVGDRGTLQLGASARAIPSYTLTFEPSGDEVEDLSSTVYGMDATYGWSDDTGLRTWTLGGEVLFNTGDTGSTITDVGGDSDPSNDTIAVVDDGGSGYFAFADYAWSQYSSAGLQYSAAELADGDDSDVSEAAIYYTRKFSEFHRLRLEASALEMDAGDDSVRVALQYTAFVGAHGHGVNW